MILLVPIVFVLALFIFLFFREVQMEQKRFLEKRRLDNEHILREVERFVTEMTESNKMQFKSTMI